MGNGGATGRTKSLFEDYDGFVEKFKPKKTTDDCMTPPEVYEAVLQWVRDEYGIGDRPIVRPFWPGGDFEAYDYPEGCVVVDNPPFSILSRIETFYGAQGIDYFLFAPTLTCFSGSTEKNHIVTAIKLVYENGAKINTSFVTSLGSDYVRSAPSLKEAVEAAQKAANPSKALPKYVYPPEVLTAARCGYYSTHGVDFRVRREDCCRVERLDAQKAAGKTIYGDGMLLSTRAAAEHAAAEHAAAERAAAERESAIEWPLSERERRLVELIDAQAGGAS